MADTTDWESEGFIPVVINKRDDRWEGEDEEDDIKDNWDDEEEEPKSEEGTAPRAAAIQRRRKKLADIIAEKEEKERKEAEQRMMQKLEEKPKTAEELLAEKLEQQRLQEEADLMLAKEAFGVGEKKSEGLNLDSVALKSKEDFDTFRKALVEKFQSVEKSAFYVDFLETTFREICVTLEADDIKRLSSNLNALFNEKIKALKTTKGKKKPGRGAAIKVERNAFADFGDDYDNDMDDFL